ncbi:MAG TPA: hypothetical protein PKY56_04330 [Candidatus Kapabacteria bacterium]|nr:hypothetical protein [Candidatus Kapabacteria bacterium]
MKRIIYVFILISSLNILLFSKEVDSLEKLLPKSEGIKRAIILNKIGASYDQIAPDKRLSYSLEALELGKELKIDSIIARATLNIALGYYYNQKLTAL